MVHVTGLTDGDHGFHIHEKGDFSAPDASSAGAHFNPTNAAHGGPAAPVHHAGDFGNLGSKGGIAHLQLDVAGISLGTGPSSIMGRAVVVHEKADDFTTQPTGNAGARVGCGVIRSEESPDAPTPTETEKAPTPAAGSGSGAAPK